MEETTAYVHAYGNDPVECKIYVRWKKAGKSWNDSFELERDEI